MVLFILNRFLFLGGLLFLFLLSGSTMAQKGPPAFYTTYNYTAYTVYDTTSAEPPTRVRGVSGSLTLNRGGTYKKRFSIAGPQGPVHFLQDGTFSLLGDSIRFAFTDQKGSDVQRGTFRFDPASRHLTITILGYPAGNHGVYELIASKTAPLAAPATPRVRTSRKRAR